QDGSRPFPYVQAAILRASDGALLNEAFIGSPQTAWQYPSAAVNARGDVAGTMSIVGPQTFLGSVIWISDGVNGHSLSPLESEMVVAGSQSPGANRWGDFFTTRVHSTLTNLWTTMAVAETQGAGGPEPHYVLFGRSSDGTAPSGTKAYFTYSPPNPVAGQTVSFQDLSLGVPSSWSWDFGDGKSSTVEDAIHVFSTASSYNVALTAAGAGGTDVIARTIVVLPSAPRAPSIGLGVAGAPHDPNFDFYDAIAGQAITFTASETNANQWLWDFGDGTSASGKSVVKTYSSSGMMQCHLTVSGDGVQTLVGPLIGSFKISVAVPILPLPSAAYTVSGVSRDQGTGNAVAGIGSPITIMASESKAAQYLWFFGDGTTASGQVVTKKFTQTGDWTVKLVVFGDGVATAAGPVVVEIPVDIRSCSRCPRVVPFR
ncbi:MAG TPA: PKD domain-containing protein, partial [Thermoanaerobaculia bacterium]